METELERVYIVHCSGEYVGTDSHDILICRPSDLDGALSEMAWEHHNQWSDRFEDEEDDDGIEPECRSSAHETEYTPESMDRLDCYRTGGGSFLSESGVRETWAALGYARIPFEGRHTFYEVWQYIKLWNIPVCQAGVSWQEIENWQRQDKACCDVIRVIDGMKADNLPPLIATQLQGARAMAENEINLFNANLQKVIARLKAL